MPICPRCRDEYEDGVATCADCDLPLVPHDAPIPPRIDAVLGTFHRAAATPVLAVLDRRGIAHKAVPAGEDRVEIVIDREFRDDLRAELAVNWGGLVASLPEEERAVVRRSGGEQPGWFDAPRGAWMDNQGRLQVERTEREELEEDARRTVGPTLAVLGIVMIIFGWWGDSDIAVVLGIGLLGVGVFVPR